MFRATPLLASYLFLQKLDLCKVSKEDLDFEAPFSLVMQHSTKCHVCYDVVD